MVFSGDRGGQRYSRDMRHEESLQGHRMVVTTTLDEAGRWTATATLADSGERVVLEGAYPTEDQARRAAFSAAAATVDRARASRGKP